VSATVKLSVAFALSLVGAGLIVYDLLGPHDGWLILGMVLLVVGTVVLKKG
jgi:membrane-bound ClpP family serine protease